MSLLQPGKRSSKSEIGVSTDILTRSLSVVNVETDFVEGVYEKLASVYDVFFGPSLHAGRVETIKRLGIQPEARVLEVGIGTGINTVLYPENCWVTGIDISSSMLEKAQERVERRRTRNVRLLQMDAAALDFPDESFDIVYAPFLINVVPDPVQVAREMQRVCRVNGRIIFLNHFLSSNRLLSRAEKLISPLIIHIGFKSDFDLPAFLAQTNLRPVSVEKVNFKMLSLVTCRKEWTPAVGN